MSKNLENNASFIVFKTQDEQVSVDVRFEDETIWLTQDQIGALYGVERPGITQHIKNTFAEGELQADSVGKKFLRTAADGKNYNTKHYNLDMIISLGYRVNSKIATQFRPWATKRLNEYKKHQQKTYREAELNYLVRLKFLDQKTRKKDK